MVTIKEYRFDTCREFVIDLPKDAEILSVRTDYNETSLFALVDMENETVYRTFVAYGIGSEVTPLELEDQRKFIGSYLDENIGCLVFLFEIVGREN